MQRKRPNGLSNYTSLLNDELSKTLNKLQNIDEYKTSHMGSLVVSKFNTEDLIRKADKDIKTLNYQLSTIITNGDSTRIINPDVPT